MERRRFLAVGEAMLDVVVSGPGHEARTRATPGGSAVLAAAWAAEAGAQAAVVGRVGNDFAGRAIRDALRNRGIEPVLSVDDGAPTGTFLLVDGEIRADRGATARLSAEALPERLEATVVLVSGYLQPPAVEAAVARARAEWVALTPGRLESLPEAGALIVNEDEARRLTGSDPAAALPQLARRFRLACVTRGPKGALAALDGETASVEGSGEELPSALGAGDAFAAGLLVALATGKGLSEALESAAVLGARAAVSGPWPDD